MSRSRDMTFTACLVTSILIATGCSKPASNTTSAAEQIQEATPGVQTSVTQTAQGTLKTVTGDNLPLPVGFPRSLPLPSGYRVTSISTIDNRISMNMSIANGGQQVIQNLLTALEQDKWKVSNPPPPGDSAMISAEKDGKTWIYTIAGSGSQQTQAAVAGEMPTK